MGCDACGVVQLVTLVDDRLVAEVDDLVAAGVVASPSEAVRLGLERLVESRRRARLGAQVVQGYRDRPQDDAEAGWADASTIWMIEEEPW